ncbi:MAG: mechanosensitive ion channel protein MscS [Rickettsiaceae bacterium]|jgi:MscS family membrane protein|nr:mechanosensitive ion channel protein MscS [Rickettsiaceae bacterium]
MEKLFISTDKVVPYLWGFLILIGILLFAYFVIRTLLHLIILVVRRFFPNKREFIRRYICPTIAAVSLFLASLTATIFQELYELPEGIEAKLTRFNATFYIISIVWLFIKIVNSFSEVLHDRFIREDKFSAAAMIPLFRKLGNVFIIVIALLFCLQNWHVDIGSLLAALGVGGIAVALASQKSFENVFGGIVLSIDQPIRVGDFGKFGEVVGTVEDIGLRSVRIRTLSRTLVTFPNSQFSSMEIESYTVRDKILFSKTIGLRHDTNSDQIRQILEQLKTMFKNDKMLIDLGTIPVRLVDFKSDSIDLEFFFYVNTSDWNEYLAVQQDLLLKIKEIVENCGSALSIPYRAVYLKNSDSNKEAADISQPQ